MSCPEVPVRAALARFFAVRPRLPAKAAVLMAYAERPLTPRAHHQLAEIADRLRHLPCDDSVVAMDVHRIAREIEALVARTTPLGRALSATAPQRARAHR